MGKVNQTALRNWNNGETVTSQDYKRERDLIVEANNDTHDRFLDEQANFQQIKTVVEENVPKIEAFETTAAEVETKGNYALAQGDYAKGQGNAVQQALEKSVNLLKSPTKPDGIVEGRLWLDTSDNAYQGTVFNELNTQLAHTETDLSQRGVNINTFKKDGLTDDEIIQNAVDYMRDLDSGKVFVPDGEYLITKPITLYSNITVELSARAELLSDTDIEIFRTEGVSGVTYSNIHVLGGRIRDRGQISRTKYHINLINVFFSSVVGCKIFGKAMTKNDVAGISLTRNGTIPSPSGIFVNTIKDCILNQASIVTDSSDSWICNNAIWAYSRSFGIHVRRGSQFISENQIVGSSVHGGIYVEDTVDGFDIELMRIVNNYFDGSYADIDSGIGIKAVKMIDSVISGNDFWRQMDEGIILISSLANKITSNTFKNNNRRNAHKADIVLTSGGSNIVSANTFTQRIDRTNKGKCIEGTSQNNSIYGNIVFFNSNYQTPRIDLPSNNILFNNKDSYVQDTVKLPSKSLLTFYRNEIPASLSLGSVESNGSGTRSYVLGHKARVLKISLVSSQARSAGTLTLTIFRNSTNTGETLTFSSGVWVVTRTLSTPLEFSPTDAISLRVTTTSDWAPTNANITVSLLMEIDE